MPHRVGGNHNCGATFCQVFQSKYYSIAMKTRFVLFISFLSFQTLLLAQGVGIPSKTGGIGFGNLSRFTGIRFNWADKNLEKVNGINVTVWQTKSDSDQTGAVNGLAVGLPIAMGSETQKGLGVGIFGVGARQSLSGIYLGGLGVGAGGNVKGIAVGGLGVGTGGDLKGLNVGGLGAGAGGNVAGINIGGLGIGAGGNLSGFSFGGLGAGSGKNVSGITIGGLGVGAGGDLKGLSIGGVGVGSGGEVTGITIGGVGVGSGKEVKGLAIAGIGVGAPKVRAIVVSLASGGNDVGGLIINPAVLQVGSKTSEDAVMGGLSVSAFNYIRGMQKGVTIGVFNYTRKQKGLQIGVLNYVKENPKGLRCLPLFNMRFGKKAEDQ